jgi:hypothetical protein
LQKRTPVVLGENANFTNFQILHPGDSRSDANALVLGLANVWNYSNVQKVEAMLRCEVNLQVTEPARYLIGLGGFFPGPIVAYQCSFYFCDASE